jgi:hypothetical protein
MPGVMQRLEPKLANTFAGSPELVRQSACPHLMVQLHLYYDLDYPQVGPTCVKVLSGSIYITVLR